jgi:hypothetical protein
VLTRDNGGVEQRHPIARHGLLPEMTEDGGRHRIEQTNFEDYAAGDLGIEVTPQSEGNGRLPVYRRLFRGPAEEFFGAYGPDDEPIDPEDLRT